MWLKMISSSTKPTLSIIQKRNKHGYQEKEHQDRHQNPQPLSRTGCVGLPRGCCRHRHVSWDGIHDDDAVRSIG